MESTAEPNPQPRIRVMQADELDDFVAWLEGDGQPFYEPLGRAMVATAELEAALRELLVYRLGRGEAWAVVHQLDLSQVLNSLGSIGKQLDEGADRDWLATVLREANDVLEPRNLLAHGLWVPLYRQGMAVVRHKRGRPGMQGKQITVDDVLELAKRASALETTIQDHVPPPPLPTESASE